MKLPTLCPLSNLTALTELSLTDTHNRHSLPGLQHLSSLSLLRYAVIMLPYCNTTKQTGAVQERYLAMGKWLDLFSVS